MVKETKGRFLVMIDDRRYGSYRTIEVAMRKDVQVLNSQRSGGSRPARKTSPPWGK